MTPRQVERTRRAWLTQGTTPRQVTLGERLWGAWRKQTIVDEIGYVIAGVAVIAGVVWAIDTRIGTVTIYPETEFAAAKQVTLTLTPWPAVITLTALAVLAAGVTWVVARGVSRGGPRDALYVARNYSQQWHEIINVRAGFRGRGPTLHAVTLGPMVVDPHAADPHPPFSVLPTGDKPEWIEFTVYPGPNDPPAEQIAAAYLAIHGECARWEINVTDGHQLTFTLFLWPLPPLRDLKPDRLPEVFQRLCGELGLGDKQGNLPSIVPGTFEIHDEHGPAGDRGAMIPDPVLSWRPECLVFNLQPRFGDTGNEIARIARTIADRLGYTDASTGDWTPGTGVPVALYRDGMPPLFPIGVEDIEPLWSQITTELWGTVKGITPPTLLAVEWEPGTPRTDTGARQSILANPPAALTLKLDVDDPRAVPEIVSRWRHRLAYHRLDHHTTGTDGLTIQAWRDPLPKGERVPIGRLPTTGPFLLGRTYHGPMEWDLNDRPHCAVWGETGAGKGDFEAVAFANALRQDMLVFNCNGKNTPEARKLAAAVVEITDTADVAAFAELLLLETRWRNFLMGEAADGRWTDGQITSIRDRAAYLRLAAEMYLPPIGPRILSVWDEVSRYLHPDMEQGAPKDEKEMFAQLRKNVVLVSEQARSSGVHLLAATQTPYYDSFGGGRVVSNYGYRVALRIIKKESFQMLNTEVEPWERDLLTGGDGKGHNLHYGPSGLREGQVFWAGDDSDWIADAIVPDYLGLHPEHEPRGRDWQADLLIARRVFGDGSVKALRKVDPAEVPYVLGHRSLRALTGATV